MANDETKRDAANEVADLKARLAAAEGELAAIKAQRPPSKAEREAARKKAEAEKRAAMAKRDAEAKDTVTIRKGERVRLCAKVDLESFKAQGYTVEK